MPFQCQASDVYVIANDIASDIAGYVRDCPRLVGVGIRAAGATTEKCVVSLERKEIVTLKVQINASCGGAHTQLPPSSPTQPCAPTQRSAEPESTSKRKSLGGVPTCTVAISGNARD